MLYAAVLTLAFAADEPKLPEVGKPAPDIRLPATSIKKVLPDAADKRELSLKDLQGKNVVLYFYPRALTKGCTVESCGFRDRLEKFNKLDTVVIGISIDPVAKQQQFTDKEKLNFPLLADVDGTASKAYGAIRPDGKTANRYTFVIDKKGVLRKVYTTVAPAKHPDEVYEYIKENLEK